MQDGKSPRVRAEHDRNALVLIREHSGNTASCSMLQLAKAYDPISSHFGKLISESREQPEKTADSRLFTREKSADLRFPQPWNADDLIFSQAGKLTLWRLEHEANAISPISST